MIIDNGSSCVYCFFLQKINVSFIMAFFFLVTWNISFVTEWVSGLVKSNIQYVIRLWITFNSNVSSKRNSPSPTRNHIVIGFYFNQVVMRVHGIGQLWECVKTFISNFESVSKISSVIMRVYYYLQQPGERRQWRLKRQRLRRAKDERRAGGYLDKRLFSLTTMLKWTWVHGNAKKIKAKQKYSSQEKIKREI